MSEKKELADEVKYLSNVISKLTQKIECNENGILADNYSDYMIIKMQETKSLETLFNNNFIDKLVKLDLTSTEYAVIFCIARFTLGIGINSCKLSVAFISRYIKKDNRYVKACINNLIDRGIVIVLNAPLGKTRELRLNQEIFEGYCI